MGETTDLYIIYTLMVIVLALIFIYIYVFAVNKETKHIALDTLGIDTFLAEGNVKQEIMRTYLNPHDEPYINIAISYPEDKKPVGLSFQIFDDSNKEVSYSIVVLKETKTYKSIRIYFKNNKSKYYSVNYTLPINESNVDSVNIMFIELKI